MVGGVHNGAGRRHGTDCRTFTFSVIRPQRVNGYYTSGATITLLPLDVTRKVMFSPHDAKLQLPTTRNHPRTSS